MTEEKMPPSEILYRGRGGRLSFTIPSGCTEYILNNLSPANFLPGTIQDEEGFVLTKANFYIDK